MSEEFEDLSGFSEWDDKPAGDSRRRKMNLFYLVDTSGSMEGDKIASVNEAMLDAIRIVSEISNENKDNAEIFVSALLFDSKVRWMYSEPLASDEFSWMEQKAWGGTSLGQACTELEKAMHRSTQLNSTNGHKNPAIILLSDGVPTDNFEVGLEILKKNNWFRSASKIAFAIGTEADANIDNLIKFTGSKEMVIKVTDIESLKEMIQVATAVVSKVGSQSASAKSNGETMTDKEEIIETIKNATEDLSGAATGDDIYNLPPTDEFD